MVSPPIDLLGRTPLGRAMTSPNPKARAQRSQLEQALFSPRDLSIIGEHHPVEDRMKTFSTLHMSYGMAEMPGLRIDMEDATVAETWSQQLQQGSGSNTEYSLLGVCDGHGDRGLVSKFIASNVSSILRDRIGVSENNDKDLALSVEHWQAIWYSTCLQLDDMLRQKKDLEGGCTGVFALITTDVIVVANVGDSRCILIQKGGDDDSGNVEASTTTNEEPPALEDEAEAGTEEKPLIATNDTVTEENKSKLMGSKITVKPLSFDHKPDLAEESARVEKAGLKVVSETFEENGEEMTIHKIAKGEKDMLAVSRAFGDFEYKSNTTLGPEEQAVSCMADIQVHKRDPERDLYLVLACDGVWDVMTNEQVGNFVYDGATNSSQNVTLPDLGDSLLMECLQKGSRDNMSTIVASLQEQDSRPADATSPEELPPPKALEFGSSPIK